MSAYSDFWNSILVDDERSRKLAAADPKTVGAFKEFGQLVWDVGVLHGMSMQLDKMMDTIANMGKEV